MSVISMKKLLEVGVHFGHQTKRWNPKMAPYIFTSRNGIYIIDLQKSSKKIDEAYKAMNESQLVNLEEFLEEYKNSPDLTDIVMKKDDKREEDGY